MRVFTPFLIITLMLAGSSQACNLESMPFGSKTKQVVEKYNLDVLQIKNEGNFVIPERGRKVCPDLQKDALIEFMFIDDMLVQVKIDNKNINGELRAYVKNVFGRNDDNERKDVVDPKSDMALWNSSPSYAVVYSAHKRGRDDIEMLEITSKKYKWLFDKMVDKNN